MARKKKPEKSRAKDPDFDLFGDPIKKPPRPGHDLAPLIFEGQRVRYVMIKGEPWWVLVDVARILGYQRTSDAAKLLRDKEKGAAISRTPGGEQEVIVINEPGLYRLIMRSNKPEAERFQDWVTEEVLPSIRQYGYYIAVDKDGPFSSVFKQLRTRDIRLAKDRIELKGVNRRMHQRMAREGAKPIHFRNRHNAKWKGAVGRPCNEVRKAIGLKSYRYTPLDHTGGLVLSMHLLATQAAERIIADYPGSLPPDSQDRIMETAMSQVVENGLRMLGNDYVIDFTTHPERGRIIDVVRVPLNAPG